MGRPGIGIPLSVGEARNGRGENMGRGVEILDREGLTVGNALPWARAEIVRIVNAHPDLLNALRIAIADSCGGCGECVPCQTLASVEAGS